MTTPYNGFDEAQDTQDDKKESESMTLHDTYKLIRSAVNAWTKHPDSLHAIDRVIAAGSAAAATRFLIELASVIDSEACTCDACNNAKKNSN